MNNVVPKNEWIKSWSDNGVGWVRVRARARATAIG